MIGDGGLFAPGDLPDPSPSSVQDAFEKYHRENREVYTRLVGMARNLRAAGAATYSISALFESLRFPTGLGGSSFHLSNSYRSRYVRAIEEAEPDLRGFFKTRPLRS